METQDTYVRPEALQEGEPVVNFLVVRVSLWASLLPYLKQLIILDFQKVQSDKRNLTGELEGTTCYKTIVNCYGAKSWG